MTHRVLNSYKSKANITIKWEGIFCVSLSIYDVYVRLCYIYTYIYVYVIYIYIYIYICMNI